MMDATMTGEVRDELRRISDRGELASRQMLREAVGIGARDLEEALTELREAGEATEAEPDGYRLIAGGEEPPADEEEPEEEPEPEQRETTLGRAVRAVEQRRAGEVKRVTLTLAVAQAVGKEGLGNLVLAGIEEADAAGVGFVLEVTT
jgi:biotin operon repressor